MNKEKWKNKFITQAQVQKFNEGKNYKSYEFLGAINKRMGTKEGYSFAVWAPNAYKVAVVGDFNDWDKTKNEMFPQEQSGVWHCFIKNAKNGQKYKYLITSKNGEEIYKADPFARFSELRPDTASVIYDISSEWSDGEWRNKKHNYKETAMLIYEVHLGSFKKKGEELYNYREIADELSVYASDMGYTHIELMPISEHPYEGSWGYQVTGYFSPTSRYGTPEDFMYFVNKFHEKGIGVIIDWVPAHFPRDAHGLARFDGSALYEYPDSRKGEHKEWGTYVFDYGRKEVVSFLISSAFYWLEQYHIDGIRVDAVSSMLYLDYGREEWIANQYGGKENLEAIAFIKELNEAVHKSFPNAIMIAEESTAWPYVTKDVNDGGLGFDFKWNMGWMNDSLRYMSMDPYFRKYNHNMLTFSMLYAFSESFILPISHDEVVHGKASLVQKMSGLYEQKFSSLKTFFMYMMAHPGKKLLFMGCEIAQFDEWNHEEEVQWNLLEFEKHASFHRFVKELNHFYKNNKPLWEIDDSWDGFEWINPADEERSIISFIRKGKKEKDDIIVICNFTPVRYESYVLGVPCAGYYKEVFSTEDKAYGGGGNKLKAAFAKKKPFLQMPYSISIDIEPMSSIYLKRGLVKKRKPQQGGFI